MSWATSNQPTLLAYVDKGAAALLLHCLLFKPIIIVFSWGEEREKVSAVHRPKSRTSQADPTSDFWCCSTRTAPSPSKLSLGQTQDTQLLSITAIHTPDAHKEGYDT